MTIKPLINQKSSKDDQNPENSQQNVRSRQVNNVNENQPLQREKRVHTPHNFDNENLRHRRSLKSPLKNKRDHHHHKRLETRENTSPSSYQVLATQNKVKATCSSPLSVGGGRSPKTNPISTAIVVNNHQNNEAIVVDNLVVEEQLSGYNSGDEHIVQKEATLTPSEWKTRDDAFLKKMSDRGFVIKEIAEDGACLFRAISLQIYGDQDMHEVIRQQTMDYIYKNREYFAQFVTEDIDNYVERKRLNHVHGNHIEIQAMSEIYNRSVELYCYQLEPINIFNSEQLSNGNEPLRLSYQRHSHYNAILNPYKASVGVGLGLAGYRPDELDIKQINDAVRLSEELEIEQTMFEDKLKTTDWEATNEAIEEQIARESYLQWCRDNIKNSTNAGGVKSTSTITSTDVGGSTSSSIGSCSTALSIGNKSPKSQQDILTSTSSSTVTSDNLLREFRKSTSPTSSFLNQSCGAGGSSSSSKNSSYELSSPETSSFQPYFSPQQHNRSRKKRSPQPPNIIETQATQIQQQQQPQCVTNKKVKLSPPSNNSKRFLDYEEQQRPQGQYNFQLAGTSSSQQYSPTKEVFSEFYRSLLESSYPDEGIKQLSEREMIQKALELSAMDFVKNSNVARQYDDKSGTTDEEYDSPSP
uniref:ubiquitinyl hydrolase 1 n=1 Tax=Corethrella appendiculata TaxID=1370023 RepID=U5ERB5_9DIPT